MPLSKILVVDDEPTYRASISRCLTNNSYRVTAADSGERALELLSTGNYDLLITDLKMPGISGLDLIKKIREISPNTATIIMTAYATIETAVEATKSGAFHYLVKPFNIEELVQLAQKAIEHKKLRDENVYLKRQMVRNAGVTDIVGKSKAIQEIVDLIKKLGDSDSNILITGETGTGKDLVAKAIHSLSRRSKKLMVHFDCINESSESLEAELFGYVKGAFAGAVSSKEGKVDLADGGTLFLDNISELPLNTQSKLLQLIKEKTYCPLGSNRASEADVRIIATTNRDVENAVGRGSFRKDLYYELNVIPICMPPVRDRKEDIPLLVNHFVKVFSFRGGKRIDGISKDAMEVFVNYSWPGNITEMQNFVERLVVSCGNRIELSDVSRKYFEDHKGQVETLESVEPVTSPKLVIPDDGIDLNNIIRELEDHLITQALTRTNGNKNQAAKLLRLNRTTLVEKLRKRGAIKSRNLTV
jgi:DNA-binding NtrC family response regulator